MVAFALRHRQDNRLITRRRVIYLHGYDPQGAKGYYGLFANQLKRASALWQTRFTLGDLVLESNVMASWTVDMAGGNWQVATRYDFVRYEDLLDAALADPLTRQVPRGLHWLFDDLVSGAAFRIWRAAWRFQMHFVLVQLGLLAWLAASAAAAAVAWHLARAVLDLNLWLGSGLAVIAAIVAFWALRPLAERWFVIRVNNGWPYYRAFGRGDPTFFDRPVETGARRLKAAVDAGDADEIVVVGHSGGGVLAPCVVARALELDPELGRSGPKVLLLTTGSIMPAVALHPGATRMREAIRRIAVDPGVQWIDCQARKDVMNFWNFDPVTDVGIDAGTQRCNPTFWRIRFRDLLSEDLYRKLNGKFFRLHYQFIMANNLRASYDYFMLTCGPLPVMEWVSRGIDAVAEFSPDGRYFGKA
jgi:hypothetical protein